MHSKKGFPIFINKTRLTFIKNQWCSQQSQLSRNLEFCVPETNGRGEGTGWGYDQIRVGWSGWRHPGCRGPQGSPRVHTTGLLNKGQADGGHGLGRPKGQ